MTRRTAAEVDGMGLYSEHWRQYQRDSTRGLVRLLAWIGIGLPLLALIGYGLSQVTPHAVPLQVALAVAWLVVLTRMAIAQSRVTCPACGAVYSRGKYLCNCPSCGLRMLQEDP